MSAPARKPWPMRWVVIAIIACIVPYTYVTIKYRKPQKAFEPYADMKDQANVNRLLAAGYKRVILRAERPFPDLPAADITLGSAAVPAPAPAGLPEELAKTLIDAPRLPRGYQHLIAPAELAAATPGRLQFTAQLEGNREQLGGAELYRRDGSVVIVPLFEPAPGDLQARSTESTVLLEIPPGALPAGRYEVTLVGARDSLSWTVLVR